LPRLVLKFGEVRKLLLEQGFTLERQEGSHKQYIKNDDIGNRIATVTLAGDDSDTIAKTTLRSIMRQSMLPNKKFKNLKRSKKVARAEEKKVAGAEEKKASS